ncbi:GATA transcription factor 9 [Rhynchospora pubera]|uniref:GATA transcription factor 9 n=1 Tax=Rhynchospora pubera TaxID=906938 RepID=A0AAV8FGB7_9POAL|nr:GATA transcription factor 9 [Rhynchospora pubera]KAJ4809430.1 GATA transcription factor 9 [Rhynchospora pubera]
MDIQQVSVPSLSLTPIPNASVASASASFPCEMEMDSNHPQTQNQNQDGNDDYSTLEWLSIYVEDCLSSGTTTYCTQPQPQPGLKPDSLPVNPVPNCSLNSKAPSKTEFKRKRICILYEEPPLVPNRTEWLADSEPIYPLSQPKPDTDTVSVSVAKKKKHKVPSKVQKEEKAQRRCTHCLSNKTPQWREGPMGPKTLCNACGVRFKSGRLLPEYRPAKSPTFVSWMHSNSHKKVLEMRNASSVSPKSD